MKFLVSFLFALAQSAPEKGGNLERWYADGIERDPCVYNTDLENGNPVVYWNEDSSGLSGNVTFQRYQDNQDCWVPIGSSCKVGVEAEFTYVQVQAKRDNVHFTYMTQNGWFGHAAGVSGCYPSIACDLNHPWITIKKISPMLEIGKYVMEGIDHQVKLMSDGSQSGGTVKLSWSCLPEKPTTTTTLLTTTTTTSSTTKLSNVFEMAEARLTGRFKPLNAANYGCAGRDYLKLTSTHSGLLLENTLTRLIKHFTCGRNVFSVHCQMMASLLSRAAVSSHINTMNKQTIAVGRL